MISDHQRATELSRLLAELPTMSLLPSDWDAIASQLHTVADGGGDGIDEAIDRLSQLSFEARVQRRFHAGRASSSLPPTKQTSALPWVGGICAGLLGLVGGSLGGGPVLAGVAVLAVFVFGVALAGSRIAHRGRGNAAAASGDEPVPAPAPVLVLIDRLRPVE